MERNILTPKQFFIALLMASPFATMGQDFNLEDNTPPPSFGAANESETRSTGSSYTIGYNTNYQNTGSTTSGSGSGSGSGPGFNGTVDDGCTVPLSDGISVLLLAGVGLGIKKYRDMKKQKAIIA